MIKILNTIKLYEERANIGPLYDIDNLEEVHHNMKPIREQLFEQVLRVANTMVRPEIVTDMEPDENGSYYIRIRETAILKEK